MELHELEKAKIEVFNAADGRCRCRAPLSYTGYGNMDQPTGWVLHERDGVIEPVCAGCVGRLRER